MKLTIDQTNKKIIIEEDCNIQHLNDFLEKFIPKEDTKTWTIRSAKDFIYAPTIPFVIERWRELEPHYWRNPIWYTTTDTTSNISFQSNDHIQPTYTMELK